METKSWFSSKINWASWILALLGGLVAGIQIAQEKGLSLPWWVLAATPVLIGSILPFLRSLTTEKVTRGNLGPIAVGLAIALGGIGIGMGESGTVSTSITSTPKDIIEEVQPLDVEEEPLDTIDIPALDVILKTS